MPSSAIDKVLEKFISVLMTAAKEAGEALQGKSIVKWHLPEELREEGSKFDFDKINKAFDRTAINDAYKIAQEKENQKQMRLQTTQGDVLGAGHRDYLRRHMTRAMCFAQDAARRLTHGDESGVPKRVIQRAVEDATK